MEKEGRKAKKKEKEKKKKNKKRLEIDIGKKERRIVERLSSSEESRAVRGKRS